MLVQFFVLAFFSVFPSLATIQLYTSNSTFTGSRLSSACKAALTSSIDCDASLQILPSVNFAAANFLSTICNSLCSASLSSYRASIAAACPADNFLLVTGTQYQPTFPADYVTYYYNATCLMSGSSYCLDNEGSYYNLTQANADVSTYDALPESMVCDPCFLLSGQLQLQTPFAHSDDLANNWTSIMSRCDTSAYTYMPPSQTIAAPSLYQTQTVNSTRANSTTCYFGSYVVQSGDTCASIQSARSIVADQLMALNGLDENCSLTTLVGSTLCLPQACELYIVQANDTCASIGAAHNLTFSQVVSLNFQLDPPCETLPDRVGSAICLGLSGYSIPTPTAYPVTTATAAMPPPTGIPVAPETDPSECGEWHVVVGGDTCNQLSINFQLSLTDLYQLNPMLDANCSNLFLNYSYCVEGFNVSFNDGGATGTVGPASWPTPSNVTFVDSPYAPGTVMNCSTWWTVAPGDSCSTALDVFAITLDELQALNPSLSPDCDAALVVGTLYCVDTGATPTSPNPPIATPSNVAPGVVAGCTVFFEETDLLCFDIAAQYNITVDQFEAWNGGADVCNVLQPGESYCVSGPTATPTSPPPTGIPTPTDVAPGVIAGCTAFFEETDLLCYEIAAQFNITVDQFEDWNGGADVCNVLQSGESYCVGAPTGSSTSSPTGVPTPTDVAPGVIAGCTAFFEETDLLCFQIAAQYNITVDQFEAWNGGADVCNVLQSGESYCVGAPSSSTTTTTTTSIPTPTDVAPGVIAGCVAFFEETDLLCFEIAAQYNITVDQFEAWNGGADVCNVLQTGESYCVQGPAT